MFFLVKHDSKVIFICSRSVELGAGASRVISCPRENRSAFFIGDEFVPYGLQFLIFTS